MVKVVEVNSGLFTGTLRAKKVQEILDKYSDYEYINSERISGRRFLIFSYQKLLLFFRKKESAEE